MKKLAMSVVIAALAAPMVAQTGAPARVAVINVQKVLAESTSGKTTLERLKKMQDERVAKAKKMDEEVQALDAQINQKKMSLSEEKLAEMTKDLSDRKISMQRYAQDADREVSEARDRALQDLEKQIMPLINQIGKEMGFAAIFNKFESGLVYASDAIDITDMVVKRFNEVPATATVAPAK